MQIEGLNFLKVQKSLRAKSMNKKKKKSQMKIRVDFQTTKYLVFFKVLGEKMNKDGGVNIVV